MLLVAMLWAGSAKALTLQQVGSGFEEPVYVTSDPANPDRLFVVEREGTVILVQSGEMKSFANIRAAVSCCEGERGLLSIALAPDFDSSGRFFLYYTGKVEPGEIHVAENPSSELGKLLRLPSPGALATPEVWSLGLRNPFRFSFDQLTGDLWIGDVGQGKREEVDFAAAPGLGKNYNYGWNCLEGSIAGPATDPECATAPADAFTLPAFEYPHPVAGESICGGAIVGGYVVRGPQMGDLYGRYLYGDYCNGSIHSFSPAAPSLTDRYEGKSIAKLTSFGEDACGRLYATSETGVVDRLVGPETAICPTSTPVYTPPQKQPSYIGIRAVSRKVVRHRRGLITAWVTPCKDRRGDPVTLWRGRRNMGTRYLDRACSARFRPRIDRRSSFRVTARENDKYLPTISRKLTLKPVHRHHRHR